MGAHLIGSRVACRTPGWSQPSGDVIQSHANPKNEDTGGLARGEESPLLCRIIVASEMFIEGSQDSVSQQVYGKDLTIKALTSVGPCKGSIEKEIEC